MFRSILTKAHHTHKVLSSSVCPGGALASGTVSIAHQFSSGAATHRLPRNLGILFVPQQEAWVVQRFGRFSRILEPGLNLCIPVVDQIAYVQLLKEIAIDIPEQTAITTDNVALQLNGVLYLKVFDPYKASYGVEDPEYAITQLAQTTMRSEIGKITLDAAFQNRESLNLSIVQAINKASEPWGINCLRYEIRDIRMPSRIQEAMQMQVEAERKKRAAVLEAEAAKRSKILRSEGQRLEAVNKAAGEAEALLRVAEAKAEAIERVASSIGKANGQHAVSLNVAEKYIGEFGKLAQTNNTLILPASVNDPASMIGQAMTIYNTLSSANTTAAAKNASEFVSTEGVAAKKIQFDDAELERLSRDNADGDRDDDVDASRRPHSTSRPSPSHRHPSNRT